MDTAGIAQADQKEREIRYCYRQPGRTVTVEKFFDLLSGMIPDHACEKRGS